MAVAINLNLTVSTDPQGRVSLMGDDNRGDVSNNFGTAVADFAFALGDPNLRWNLARMVYAYHLSQGNPYPSTYNVQFSVSTTPIVIARTG